MVPDLLSRTQSLESRFLKNEKGTFKMKWKYFENQMVWSWLSRSSVWKRNECIYSSISLQVGPYPILGRRHLLLGRQNLCCSTMNGINGSPYCVIFCMLGHQLPNVENRWFFNALRSWLIALFLSLFWVKNNCDILKREKEIRVQWFEIGTRNWTWKLLARFFRVFHKFDQA